MRVSSYWLIITSFLLAAATKPLPAQAPNGRPVPVSVSPAYGNGSEQTFQFLWEDPDGFEDLSELQVVFSPDFNGRKPGDVSCTIGVATSSKAITLLNDADKWTDPIGMGSVDKLENSACEVDGAGSSMSGSGKQLTVSLHLKFKQSLSGLQFINMRVWDQTIRLAGSDPRRKNGFTSAVLGTWTVGAKTACQATFSRGLETIDSQSHEETVSVNATPGCRWAASAGASWIKIVNNKVEKGSGTLTYTIAANPTGSPRRSVIFIGPVYLAIEQAGSTN
jgi:hypothetical protein